jgi:hypothetical protein
MKKIINFLLATLPGEKLVMACGHQELRRQAWTALTRGMSPAAKSNPFFFSSVFLSVCF